MFSFGLKLKNMLNVSKDCKWQTKDKMDAPTNPMQSIYESYTRQSFDMAERKFDAWMYGVVVGWDDESYDELKKKHNWSDSQIEYQKQMHQNFIKCWNLFMEDKL